LELTDNQTVVEKPSGFTPYCSLELPGSATTADLFDFTVSLWTQFPVEEVYWLISKVRSSKSTCVMSDDQHVIPVNWCCTLINQVLDIRPAKSDSLRPAPRGEKKDSYKLKDLRDKDGGAAAAGSLDGMSSPKKSLLPPSWYGFLQQWPRLFMTVSLYGISFKEMVLKWCVLLAQKNAAL
jgi:hypothetical protein